MPKFIFQCANCSKSYQKTEDLTGRKVKCGRCKTVFVVRAEPVADQTRNSPVEQALPWTPTPAHRGKPDSSPQTATAPDAIPQASLVNPAIEEDEIIDAQIVPEAPMSPAPHAHQGMYGHPPAQQNFLQQDYSQHRISISRTLSHMVNCRRRPRLKNELRQTRNFFESLS